MTQFALCVFASTPPDDIPGLEFVPIESEPEFLQENAAALYPESPGALFVPRCRDGRLFHDLFNEGHDALINGDPFEETLFATAISPLLDRCPSFAFWWSDDWNDLPVFNDKAEFMSELLSQLGSPIGDVYVRWERRPSVADPIA
jgi:hypothetical protein